MKFLSIALVLIFASAIYLIVNDQRQPNPHSRDWQPEEEVPHFVPQAPEPIAMPLAENPQPEVLDLLAERCGKDMQRKYSAQDAVSRQNFMREHPGAIVEPPYPKPASIAFLLDPANFEYAESLKINPMTECRIGEECYLPFEFKHNSDGRPYPCYPSMHLSQKWNRSPNDVFNSNPVNVKTGKYANTEIDYKEVYDGFYKVPIIVSKEGEYSGIIRFDNPKTNENLADKVNEIPVTILAEEGKIFIGPSLKEILSHIDQKLAILILRKRYENIAKMNYKRAKSKLHGPLLGYGNIDVSINECVRDNLKITINRSTEVSTTDLGDYEVTKANTGKKECVINESMLNNYAASTFRILPYTYTLIKYKNSPPICLRGSDCHAPEKGAEIVLDNFVVNDALNVSFHDKYKPAKTITKQKLEYTIEIPEALPAEFPIDYNDQFDKRY